MDIKDLKTRRIKLEGDIGNLISDFANETELTVQSIDVTQISEMCKDKPVGYLINVHIEVPRY
jgi:hypothetical protein